MGQENVKPNRHIIKNNEIFWFNKKENTNESALVNDKWHVFRRYQHEREECTRLLCSLTLRLVVLRLTFHWKSNVLKVLCGVTVEENVVQGCNLPTVKVEKKYVILTSELNGHKNEQISTHVCQNIFQKEYLESPQTPKFQQVGGSKYSISI